MSLNGLSAAPKSLSLAFGALALGWHIIDSSIVEESVSSTLAYAFSDIGTSLSVGLVAYNASLSVFSKPRVIDTIAARPAEVIRIVRSAAGRVGAITTASMMAMYFIMDKNILMIDSELTIPERCFGTFAAGLVALPLSLPFLGVSYGAGWAIGGFIGRHILENRLTAGRLFYQLDKLHKSRPLVAHTLLGLAAVAAALPAIYMYDIDHEEMEERLRGEITIIPKIDRDGSRVWTFEYHDLPDNLKGDHDSRADDFHDNWNSSFNQDVGADGFEEDESDYDQDIEGKNMDDDSDDNDGFDI